MSDSEFHCCEGGEAAGVMEPDAMARGVMEPPAAAALFQRVYMSFCFGCLAVPSLRSTVFRSTARRTNARLPILLRLSTLNNIFYILLVNSFCDLIEFCYLLR